ncbi:MAG: hypothetical protein ACKOET_09665 [Verrucomicrobiota bacterium]
MKTRFELVTLREEFVAPGTSSPRFLHWRENGPGPMKTTRSGQTVPGDASPPSGCNVMVGLND